MNSKLPVEIGGKSTRRTVFGSALALASLLTGCGWFDGDKKPRLPGDRKAVLLLDEGIKADPSLANLEITLPAPERNDTWPQVGGNPAHAMYHLDAGDALEPVWQLRSAEAPAPTRS